jgi:hypothetical protein
MIFLTSELFQLVENNGEIGAWCLLHRLVAHHVELLVEVTALAGWTVQIPVSRAIGFLILSTLAVGVLRQARIMLFGNFTVLGDAVVADMKDLALESQQKRGQLEMVSVEPSK